MPLIWLLTLRHYNLYQLLKEFLFVFMLLSVIFSYLTGNVHDNEEDVLVTSWVVKNRDK